MAIAVTYEDHRMRVSLADPLESLSIFKEISVLMPPVGSFDRLVLDFSNVDQFNSFELLHLLIELEASPQFKAVEISIVNLRADAMAGVA